MSTNLSTPASVPPPPRTESRRAGPTPLPRWLSLLFIPLLIALFILAIFSWFQAIPGTPHLPLTDCAKAAHPQRSGAITEYCLPMRTMPDHAMAVGPDGNLWLTDSVNSRIIRITPRGSVTAFAVPARPGANTPAGIARGPDGNLWYIAQGRLGRISPQGATGSAQLPYGAQATSLTRGPDGNLWLSETLTTGRYTTDMIATMTRSGQFTEYNIRQAGFITAGGLTPGRDGNVWFVGTTSSSAAIGRITPAGMVTVFPQDIPVQSAVPGWPSCEGGACIAASNIGGLTMGADGNLWFVDGRGRIGRMTPSGATTFIAVHGLGELGAPPTIAAGPDGNLWVNAMPSPQENRAAIARLTLDGTATTFPLPHTGAITAITSGPDGGVWFLLVAYGMSFQETRVVRITP